MRSFACPEEQTSPTTPENQLGVSEVQRAVKHSPDGLTMQPGFMAWSRTEAGSLGAGVLSFTLLCHEAQPAGKSHGPHTTWWPKQNSHPLLRSPHPLAATRAQPLTHLQTHMARKVS